MRWLVYEVNRESINGKIKEQIKNKKITTEKEKCETKNEQRTNKERRK